MYNVKAMIDELSKEYDNVPAIFGGALFAYENIKTRGFDVDYFVGWLDRVVRAAERYNWHEGVSGALERFCRLCLVDPRLIEAHLDIRFKELDNI